ncbi:MAG: hypothetical protein DCC68_09830 [Planctomycetota bacterium]|nr:MAG: hypothetical protein DCC68_09830 [Planctomycetota bacterium]
MMPAWITLLLLLGFLLTIALLIKWAGNRAVGSLFIVAAVVFACLVFYLRYETAQQAQQARDVAIIDARSKQIEEELQRRLTVRETSTEPGPAGFISDDVLTALPPRAPEPDDDAIARSAPPAVRDAPAPTPESARPPELTAAPAWITQGVGRQADGEYYKVVSATGTSADECWNRLYVAELPMAVHEYAIREIGGTWPYPLVDGELVDLLVADQYLTPWREGGVKFDGTWNMQKLYLRLHFQPAVRERLVAQRTEVLRSSRVTYTAWLGVLACGALGIVFGYLKLDDQTAGVHTRRLRIGAGVLFVGIAFCGCLLLAYFVQVESYGGILAMI